MSQPVAEELVRTLARTLGAARAWVLPATLQEVLEGLASDSVGLDPWSADEAASVCIEPLGGSPVACRDLKALSSQARAAGKVLVADVSLMGPEGCAAVRLGAQVALAEYEGSWCIVGVDRALLQAVPDVSAWLNARAAEPLPVACDPAASIAAQSRQWHAASDAAQVVASYLRCHPRVSHVRYPGLKTDPSFAIAARTLVGGFGPLVDYKVAGDGCWQRLTCTDEDPRAQVMRIEAALADSYS